MPETPEERMARLMGGGATSVAETPEARMSRLMGGPSTGARATPEDAASVRASIFGSADPDSQPAPDEVVNAVLDLHGHGSRVEAEIAKYSKELDRGSFPGIFKPAPSEQAIAFERMGAEGYRKAERDLAIERMGGVPTLGRARQMLSAANYEARVADEQSKIRQSENPILRYGARLAVGAKEQLENAGAYVRENLIRPAAPGVARALDALSASAGMSEEGKAVVREDTKGLLGDAVEMVGQTAAFIPQVALGGVPGAAAVSTAASGGDVMAGVETAAFLKTAGALTKLFGGASESVVRQVLAEGGSMTAAGVAMRLGFHGDPGTLQQAGVDALSGLAFGVMGGGARAREAAAKFKAALEGGKTLEAAAAESGIPAERLKVPPVPEAAWMREAKFDAAKNVMPTEMPTAPRLPDAGKPLPVPETPILEVPDVIVTTKRGPPGPKVVEAATKRAEAAAPVNEAMRRFEERTGIRVGQEPTVAEKPVSEAPKALAGAPRSVTKAVEAQGDGVWPRRLTQSEIDADPFIRGESEAWVTSDGTVNAGPNSRAGAIDLQRLIDVKKNAGGNPYSPMGKASKVPAEAPAATPNVVEARPATADVATATPDVAAPKARGVGYTRGADPVTDPVSAMVEAVKTGGTRIGDWFQRARDVAVGLSRRALPRMTAANPEASAAASAKAASPVAARATADRIVSEVVRPGTVGDLELGAALTEANLRDVRRGYEEAGDAAGAARVRSIIGAEGSPFKTEAEYRAFLDKPEVKAAIDRHKALFEANVESLYKESVGIPEAEALPARGSEAYGARINLKRVSPEEQPGPGQVRFYDVSANPGNVRNRRNPFSRRATGASEAYDLLYSRIIENSLSRQYETATWKRTQKALLDGGDAVLVKPGEKPPTDIKGRTPYRLVEGRLNEGTLYVRSDLAGELTRVAKINPDTPLTGRVLKPVNIAALTGPADAITNIVNVVGGTMVYPSGEGGAVAQAALKASPLHVPVAIGRVIKTALEPAAKQAAEIQTLAEVGAARIYEAVNWKNPSQWLKGVANAVDRAGRVIMLRAYRARVARGEHAFDAAQLRDWVNLLGNYTNRLQGPVMRMLSTTGVNPFIVSGRRGISMGFDAASMNPRVAGLTKRYVGTMLANWFGSMTTIGALNAAFNNGNPLPNGVPIGHVKYGEKDGKPQTFDLLPFFGLGRARDVTGAGKLIEDMRAGHDLDTAIGDAFVKIVNAQVNSLSGPVTDFGWQAMTGKPVGFDQPRVSPVRAGGRGEQLASDTMAALSNLVQLARPVIESGKAMVGMESESGDALKRLGGYFTTKSGMTDKARDTAVDRRKRANLNELALDLRRRISFGEAGDDVDGWLDKQLSDEDIPPNERIRLKVAIRRWNERRK